MITEWQSCGIAQSSKLAAAITGCSDAVLQKITLPLSHQRKAQIQAAVPRWNQIHQQQAENATAIKALGIRNWAGVEVGTVVILRPDITTKIYGVALCDDEGETILMDGTVKGINCNDGLG